MPRRIPNSNTVKLKANAFLSNHSTQILSTVALYHEDTIEVPNTILTFIRTILHLSETGKRSKKHTDRIIEDESISNMEEFVGKQIRSLQELISQEPETRGLGANEERDNWIAVQNDLLALKKELGIGRAR